MKYSFSVSTCPDVACADKIAVPLLMMIFLNCFYFPKAPLARKNQAFRQRGIYPVFFKTHIFWWSFY